jgi:erythronate-4-phosphate dehydrogenase
VIRIVTDDKIPFLEGALEGVASVKYMPGAEISNSDLKDADVLITRTRTNCNEELLKGTNVSFIASATIGIDHIDAEYCRSEGIQWANAPGCNSSSVQQYIISTLLFLAHHRNLDLHDLTLGVVGVGNVGSKVAVAAEGLGMKVLLNDPPREQQEGGGDFVALETILENSDIITMHVPLTREGEFSTYEMVNRDFFKSTKKGVSLINTSRGPVVNERALLEQIRKENLSDVVLDVFQNEPAIKMELLNSITIGTPHIAGYSQDGKANGTTMSVRAISRFFNLGLDDWEPESIPKPTVPELFADTSQGSAQELIWDLFRQTYDVSLDHQRLMKEPGAFERLRGDYPLRREPLAYSVRLFQGYSEITTQLEKLGFSVLSDHCA